MTVPETAALYTVLGVPADASQEVIKTAYRRLALQHHPDRCRDPKVNGDATSAFARIAFAYEVLGHEQRRKRYDLTGEVPQSDTALGRKAAETFMAEYVRSAPKISRVATQADMSLHSLANYEVLEVDGRDVPTYMRGIVMQGLSYLVAVAAGMEEKEVVLLRHFVMDQMYALMAYSPPLDEDAFAERGYILTYYDHPLQSGIVPTWSDQNGAENRQSGVNMDEFGHLKAIPAEAFDQRKLAALEWHGAIATPAKQEPQAALFIPGSGIGEERLQLGIRSLLQSKVDLESHTVHQVRRDLEKLLQLQANDLDGMGATRVMGLLTEALSSDESDEALQAAAQAAEAQRAQQTSGVVQTNGNHQGGRVRVKPSGRVGLVLVHDPSDLDMTYKVEFEDGSPSDWFKSSHVQLM